MTDLRDRDQRLYDAAESAFNSEGGFIAAAQDCQNATQANATLIASRAASSLQSAEEVSLSCDGSATGETRQRMRERIMEEASVTYDGRHYYYDGHRYDGLVDAVDQSVLMYSQPLHEHQPGLFTTTPPVYVRTDADLQLMIALGISFVEGWYCFKDFRYDHLADAVSYARAH